MTDLENSKIGKALKIVTDLFSLRDRIFEYSSLGDLEVRLDVPNKFLNSGGICLAPHGLSVPYIDFDNDSDLINPLLIIGNDANIQYIMISGRNPCVVSSGSVRFKGNIYCGSDSIVFLGDETYTGIGAKIDARNGGAVFVDGDALWSTDVTVYTDDMHRISDATSGERINEFGSTIHIGRHVWLGQGALLLPGAKVGQNSVVAARAVVKQAIPPNSVAAGVPARVVRSGVTWSREDLP